MIKTRVLLLSTAMFAACIAGAFWALFAIERIKPEEPAFTGIASFARPEKAPVSTPSGGVGARPLASDVRTVEVLLQRIRAVHESDGADWSELCALADTAVNFGEAAVEPLGSLARDGREPDGLRLLAIEMLGRIEQPSVVSCLMECLAVRMPENIRLAALGALGANHIATERSSWLFFDLARADERPAIRARATEFVARFGGSGAVEPLCRAVRNDPSVPVRVSAATALGELLDSDSIDALQEASLKDEDASVRAAAVNAAGNFRDARLRKFFRAVEAGDRDVQVQAAARRQLWRMPAD